MHLSDGRLTFAATDLSRFLACRHLTTLSVEEAFGRAKRPDSDADPYQKALADAGKAHERAILDGYRSEGRTVAEISETLGRAERRDRTLDAMREGVDVIWQGWLKAGIWTGYPDFLVRTTRKSTLGDWSYEVEDAKLATRAKADAVLQIAVYSWLLREAQGAPPEEMHLVLGGGGERESFRVADFAAFERVLRAELEAHCAASPPTYPEPVALCQHCDWNPRCQRQWRADDHLSLVAGAARHQRTRLEEQEVHTLAALARLELPLPKLEGVQPASLARIQRQAAAQLTGREQGRPFHELVLPPEAGRGLLRLPEPSAGDLFFDLESSRPGLPEMAGELDDAGDSGATRDTDALEYLFGFVDREGSYVERWAFDRGEERRVFEWFMDLVAERRERFPDLHIYHYGGYETGALKRLMNRFATREDAMDHLLRRQVFVDLLQVVRQGLVASVERYSIKNLEPFYGFAREQPLPEAIQARVRMDIALDAHDRAGPEDQEVIRKYNREDCASTLALHGWLEELRGDLDAVHGPFGRPAPDIDLEKEKEQSEAAARVAELVERLRTDGPSPDAESRTLLGYLLDYYRREDKSWWWNYFRIRALDAEELEADREALGGLEHTGEVGRENNSTLRRYYFRGQDHRIDSGTPVHDTATGIPPGTVVEMGDDWLVLKRGPTVDLRPHPQALVGTKRVRTDRQRNALFGLGERVADAGLSDRDRRRAAFDLLRRTAPRGFAGASLGRPGETSPGENLPGAQHVVAAQQAALALDREVLAVQGPPGSGKTYLGARVITALLAAGRRVGVTGPSHHVITNLVEALCDAADEARIALRGVQVTPGEGCGDSRVPVAKSDDAPIAAADPQMGVIAGTTWVWSRPDMRDSVDVLVVDEAGQFSLADALASAPAAKSLVVLGDPRQLDQVTQGVHPEGSNASTLGHLLGEARTIPPDRGLFLDRTWRMHPDITRFTSELFYEDRLESRPGLERQQVVGGPLPGAGLRFLPVEHQGNQRESKEEAERIRLLVDGLLEEASWTDSEGTTKRIQPEDILIVAPYNAQVDLLEQELDGRARVGTVDKFQGQEAPVVFFSMATSTPDAAPRGMDFLYSLHRLNVATSRARCIAAIVASPKLFFPECKTPDQMRLANAFCRFRELATELR